MTTDTIDIAYHQWADDREYKLVKEAEEAANGGNWKVGENACLWLQQYGRGKNDAMFAELIGLTEDQVFQRRKVWEAFGKIHKDERFRFLRWSHFRAALYLRNPVEALEWANDLRATIKEMQVWSRNNEKTVSQATGVSGPEAQRLDASPSREGLPPKERPRPSEDRRVRDRDPASGSGSGSDRDRPADLSVPVADQRPPAVSEVVTTEQTRTVAMAFEQLDGILDFITSSGTEEDLARLAKTLAPVLDEIQPLELTRKPKQGTLLASRSMANVIVDAWNMIDGVVRCGAITETRRKALAARLKDTFWKENWEAAIERIRKVPGLLGKNDRKWKATFDWFVRPDTVMKVIEGKYENWTTTGTKGDNRRENNQNAFDEVFG